MQTDQTDRTKFVVGLGNPGKQYAGTRHNVGFDVLETLRCRWSLDKGREAFSGRLNDARFMRSGQTQRVMLLEPHTYMNLSGRAVRQMFDFYKASSRDILIVLDDLALPLGRIRARANGSAGGHNGLNDIIAALGTSDVPRLRLGIGSPPPRMDSKDFVLSAFGPGERDVIRNAIVLAAQAVEDWAFRDIAYVMDKYNRSASDEP